MDEVKDSAEVIADQVNMLTESGPSEVHHNSSIMLTVAGVLDAVCNDNKDLGNEVKANMRNAQKCCSSAH